MEVPRGMEPTGTNGRTRHTFQSMFGGLGLVLWWFLVGWQGALFSCGHGNDTGEAFCFASVVRFPDRHDGIVVGSVPGRSVGSVVQSGFAVVMAQVRRPVPFRTRKLRPGCGDGTALERVWESSAPPHSTLGVPVERNAPGTLFLFFFRCPFPAACGRLFLFPVGSVCFGLPKGIFVIPQRLLVNRYFFGTCF